MGSPRKKLSQQKKHLTIAEKKNIAEQEAKLKIPRDGLIPPAWLSEEATAEFERVVEESAKADFIDNLDLSVLAIYCDSYARYIEASVYLQQNGMVTVTDKGYPMTSPYISILNQAAKNIMSCSAKLGLATTDRLKLIVPTQKDIEPVNKFIKYLDESGLCG